MGTEASINSAYAAAQKHLDTDSKRWRNKATAIEAECVLEVIKNVRQHTRDYFSSILNNHGFGIFQPENGCPFNRNLLFTTNTAGIITKLYAPDLLNEIKWCNPAIWTAADNDPEVGNFKDFITAFRQEWIDFFKALYNRFPDHAAGLISDFETAGLEMFGNLESSITYANANTPNAETNFAVFMGYLPEIKKLFLKEEKSGLTHAVTVWPKTIEDPQECHDDTPVPPDVTLKRKAWKKKFRKEYKTIMLKILGALKAKQLISATEIGFIRGSIHSMLSDNLKYGPIITLGPRNRLYDMKDYCCAIYEGLTFLLNIKIPGLKKNEIASISDFIVILSEKLNDFTNLLQTHKITDKDEGGYDPVELEMLLTPLFNIFGSIVNPEHAFEAQSNFRVWSRYVNWLNYPTNGERIVTPDELLEPMKNLRVAMKNIAKDLYVLEHKHHTSSVTNNVQVDKPKKTGRVPTLDSRAERTINEEKITRWLHDQAFDMLSMAPELRQELISHGFTGKKIAEATDVREGSVGKIITIKAYKLGEQPINESPAQLYYMICRDPALFDIFEEIESRSKARRNKNIDEHFRLLKNEIEAELKRRRNSR